MLVSDGLLRIAGIRCAGEAPRLLALPVALFVVLAIALPSVEPLAAQPNSITRAGSDNSRMIYPVGVWLQDPIRTRNGVINAVNYKNIGVNMFIGLWGWPDESVKYPGYDLQAAQALQANGIKVIAGSDQTAVTWNNANPQYASTFIG
ncbi:MAG TPA: hypothetical protein VMW73_05735, partial [Spirochaetia bacterium]|nr:hypothetical protein [Spirochaetia bacterium]